MATLQAYEPVCLVEAETIIISSHRRMYPLFVFYAIRNLITLRWLEICRLRYVCLSVLAGGDFYCHLSTVRLY